VPPFPKARSLSAPIVPTRVVSLRSCSLDSQDQLKFYHRIRCRNAPEACDADHIGPVTYRHLAVVEISKIVDLGGPQLANQNLGGGDYPLLSFDPG
jgi:hypothetical protein